LTIEGADEAKANLRELATRFVIGVPPLEN
jgi:hypothetical protein